MSTPRRFRSGLRKPIIVALLVGPAEKTLKAKKECFPRSSKQKKIIFIARAVSSISCKNYIVLKIHHS